MLCRITSLVSALALLVLLAGCRTEIDVEKAIEQWLAGRTDIAQADVTLGFDAAGPSELTITGQVADVTAAADFIAAARKQPFSRNEIIPVHASLNWPSGTGQIDLHVSLAESDEAEVWELAGRELPPAATWLHLSGTSSFVRYESTDPMLTAAHATGLPGGEIEVAGATISIRAADAAELQARAQGLGRVVQAGIEFTALDGVTISHTVSVARLDDLLPAARLLGTELAWQVEYDHESTFRLRLSPQTPRCYPLIEELVANHEPGMWVTCGSTTSNAPDDVTATVVLPSEQRCDDFLASTQERELWISLHCPIGPAGVPAADLPSVGVAGNIAYITAMMPALRVTVEAGMHSVNLGPTSIVAHFGAEDGWEASIAALRAIDWQGDRDLEATIRAADGTRLEVGWTTTATGEARDIHTYGDTNIEAEPVQRLIELWNSSATS